MNDQTHTELKNELNPLTRAELHNATQERVYEISREFTQGFKFLENYPRSVTFFGSARFTEDHPEYIRARNIAKRIVTDIGYSVVTGGGPGIMEAGNRGAKEAGGNSIGLTIRLPKEQVMNKYMTSHVDFYYFFSRKVCLNYSAEAFLFFPGGFGTLDEFFEVITLLQTKKVPQVPVILVGSSYWNNVIQFLKETLLAEKTIDETDFNIFSVVDDEEEIIEILKKAPIREFTPYNGLHVNPIEE
jgi:uncharacterized protein (TIGR00730 family)